MPIPRWTNNFTAVTTEALTTTTGSVTVGITTSTGTPPNLALVANQRPANVAHAIINSSAGTEYVQVTAATTTSLTITRAQEGSAALAHPTGANVAVIVTAESMFYQAIPGAIGPFVIAAGTAAYTPDAAFKYHLIDLSALTAGITINPPTNSRSNPANTFQIGDELRFTWRQGGTTRTVSMSTTAGAGYFNSPAVTQGTASNMGGASFVYSGNTGWGTTVLPWVRIL